MHLLAAEAQRIDDGQEAVDLALDPAPIVVLSAADSEIAAFNEAAKRWDGPAVRLASLSALTHPMSVDLLEQRTLRQAGVVAVRVLGGEGYFAYGVEVLRRLALGGGPALLLVPGEAAFDRPLADRGTVALEIAEAFHAYCREGGPLNRERALDLLAHLVDGSARPPQAAVVPSAGPYEPPGADGWPDGPAVGVVFYRSHLMDGLTGGVDALCAALAAEGMRPVPLFATSLKDPSAARTVQAALHAANADVVLTTMAFSAGGAPTALDNGRRVVLQAVQASFEEEDWAQSRAGLPVRDLTMSVVTPEFDGRILSRAIAFKSRAERDPRTGAFPTVFRPHPERARFVARLAAKHGALARRSAVERRVALVLANYPGKGGRIANGVGLDTPASTIAILERLAADGVPVTNAPTDSADLMNSLVASRDAPPLALPVTQYEAWFATLPRAARDAVIAEWGAPESDPMVRGDAFRLAIHRYGHVAVGVQPTRGYERDPKARYHDPALVPPHGYLAFYLALREEVRADAVVHVGKHGNMEWLPGKAAALSEECWPEIAFGPMAHVYPFIVNDPGEGSQAKRRAQAAIVDHLTPPMTQADSYGAGAELEALIDEYALSRALDPARAARIADALMDLAEREGFLADLGVDGAAPDDAIAALDAHICDLKELQIRDGLHTLGQSPEAGQRVDTLVAIARTPRGSAAGDVSLLRALAQDLDLSFDPLTAGRADDWDGPRPSLLTGEGAWRTAGDTVERLGSLARRVMAGEAAPGAASAAVVAAMGEIGARLDVSGARELDAVSAGLAGRFVPPGPSGAPTRGRPDVLPTGRNFFAVDIRGVPTATAWEIGKAAAERVVERYVMEEGEWPRTIMLTCWGTANMRTGGDDIAQALALIGAAPRWEAARLTGFDLTPLSALGRPRVDVTLRISGFFRDAFPEQIALYDSAVRAVAARDEPADQNPIRARFAAAGEGADVSIFGAMPGAYGAGLQALIDTGAWDRRDDLAEAFVAWGRYGYGTRQKGEAMEDALRRRLAAVDAVVQAQDNREHDLLDSDDYYQFEGGMAAAVEAARGEAPVSLHVDTSLAERPVARTLSEEIARVVRGRAANPKWIAGAMRHGYKGAFEMAATLDYLFAFAATTNAVADHHFDQLFAAYLENDTVAQFIADANRPALGEMVERFREAIRRELWSPKKNSVELRLAELEAR